MTQEISIWEYSGHMWEKRNICRRCLKISGTSYGDMTIYGYGSHIYIYNIYIYNWVPIYVTTIVDGVYKPSWNWYSKVVIPG